MAPRGAVRRGEPEAGGRQIDRIPFAWDLEHAEGALPGGGGGGVVAVSA